jgi:methylase of polypeptide subunit release factors
MRGDGFSVVIGNPPYVEYSKVKSEYRIQPDLDNTFAKMAVSRM